VRWLRGKWSGLSRREQVVWPVVLVIVGVLSVVETEDVSAFAHAVWAWLGGAR